MNPQESTECARFVLQVSFEAFKKSLVESGVMLMNRAKPSQLSSNQQLTSHEVLEPKKCYFKLSNSSSSQSVVKS
jgi:hypothetical protein